MTTNQSTPKAKKTKTSNFPSYQELYKQNNELVIENRELVRILKLIAFRFDGKGFMLTPSQQQLINELKEFVNKK